MGGGNSGQYFSNYSAANTKLQQLLGKAPATSPDFADDQVQSARQAQILTSQLRRGRQGTLLPNGQGLGGGGPVMDKTLLGD